MARQVNLLSAREVVTLVKPGYHSDGAGLYLQISVSGSKSWILRYHLNGRAREMGLGAISVLPLAKARMAAHDARRAIQDGKDPIELRKAERREQQLAQAKAKTFADCAAAYIAAHEAGWRNSKHRAQWANTLETYAGPVIGKLSIQDIDTSAVKRVLNPIWSLKPETASRLRGRIEAIIDWATVSNLRTGENPARWRGHLDHVLPKRSAICAVKHHSALDYRKMAPFMQELRQHDSICAKGLEFIILTAARTGEVIGSRWEEFDDEAKIWIVPGERMKAKRPHRVPLSPAAMTIFGELKARAQSDFVFPGMRAGKALSNMAFLQLLKRLGFSEFTTHGFRSTFRDWAAEETEYPRDVVEMALAHTIGDKVEAAYRRGDLFEKRRLLMADWATYCSPVETQTGRKAPNAA